MNLGAIEITDRKFMDYVKVISVDGDNNKITIDNSEEYNGSDIVEIIVGIENKFLMDYFKVCMNNGIVCNLEVNNDNVLICGFVDVKVKRFGDGSDEFIIEPVIKSKNIPDFIEVNVNDVNEEHREHLKDVLNDSVNKNKNIGVGLVCEKGNKGKWFIESIQVKFER